MKLSQGCGKTRSLAHQALNHAQCTPSTTREFLICYRSALLGEFNFLNVYLQRVCGYKNSKICFRDNLHVGSRINYRNTKSKKL